MPRSCWSSTADAWGQSAARSRARRVSVVHNPKMSSKQWFSALLFAGIVCSFAFSQAKAPAPPEKPSVTPSDFSKEAYVIEKSYTRIRAENDGTGTREVTVEVKV